MRIEQLTPARVDEVAQVFVEAIGGVPKAVDETLSGYFDHDRSWVGIDDDDRVLGFAGGFASAISMAGGAVLDGGAVPWVGVRVDAQGTGVGRALLEHQLAAAAAAGDAVLALNSSDYGIYGRFGYGPTGTWWSIRLDPRVVEWHPDAPTPGRVEVREATAANDDVRTLWERAFGTFPGEVARHDGYWRRRLTPQEHDKGRRLWAVHHGDDGVVDAVAHYGISQHFDDYGFANRLEVHDLFGIDERSQLRLLRWLVARRLVGEVKVMRLDPGSPLREALRDPRRIVTTELSDTTWVRLLDVEAVLSARATMATGEVRVRVRDPLVAANDRTFLLSGDGSGLSCAPTDDPPDLGIDVDLVASLAWSHVTAARLAAADRIEVHAPAAVEVLDRLLAWDRPSWCSMMF